MHNGSHQFKNGYGVLMTPLQLTGTITAIANAIACQLTSDEITLLSGILVQLGDTLVTIATINSLNENNANG